MRVYIVFIFLLVSATTALPQDGPDTESEVTPHPGLYRTFADFVSNTPIPPDHIITDRSPYGAGFYLQVYRDGNIRCKGVDGEVLTIHSIWGYCDGKHFFVQTDQIPRGFFDPLETTEFPFVRIDFPGTLALIYHGKNSGSALNRYDALNVSRYGGGQNRPKEFILDTRNGKFYKATLSNLRKLMEDDQELSKEFKKSKEDDDVKLYIFLKKYNERHPFSFR